MVASSAAATTTPRIARRRPVEKEAREEKWETKVERVDMEGNGEARRGTKVEDSKEQEREVSEGKVAMGEKVGEKEEIRVEREEKGQLGDVSNVEDLTSPVSVRIDGRVAPTTSAIGGP